MNTQLIQDYEQNKISHSEFFSKYVFEDESILLENVDSSPDITQRSMSEVKYTPIVSPDENPLVEKAPTDSDENGTMLLHLIALAVMFIVLRYLVLRR